MKTAATLLLGLVLLAAPGLAGAVIIDAFTDPYPPNPLLPVSGRQIIFVGSTCDGGACPPNAIVSNPVSDSADQGGLAGVLGGNRYAQINHVAGTANSNIVPTYGFTYNHNAGASSLLDLDYGRTVDLSADLTVNAATGFEISVAGDMYAGPRPIPCTFTVTSGRGTGSEATASLTQDLVADGAYTFPFASFAGVDFTDVDRIQVRFDASAVSAVDFAVFYIETNEPPTPVENSTWGRIKTQYR